MHMRIQHIEPHHQLKGYVEKIWVYESSGRVPDPDMKLIVPNGMLKLTIPFRNGITGQYKDWFHLSRESTITLIGISDSPAIVDGEKDEPSGTIGIEFNPIGAYRIFKFNQSELKNRIFALEDVLGKTIREIQEKIASAGCVHEKIRIMQEFLISRLYTTEPDPILDHCLLQIHGTKGSVTVSELEKQTGYSSRWLYEKFMDKVGLSPKNLSAIVRFMQFYQKWAMNPNPHFFKEDIYDYFFDQAHFSKEFKRFTGLPPSRFVKEENEFGRIFYKG